MSDEKEKFSDLLSDADKMKILDHAVEKVGGVLIQSFYDATGGTGGTYMFPFEREHDGKRGLILLATDTDAEAVRQVVKALLEEYGREQTAPGDEQPLDVSDTKNFIIIRDSGDKIH